MDVHDLHVLTGDETGSVAEFGVAILSFGGFVLLDQHDIALLDTNLVEAEGLEGFDTLGLD